MGRHSQFRGDKLPGSNKPRATEYINGLHYKVGAHGFAYVLVNGEYQRTHNADAIRFLGAKPDVKRCKEQS